MKKRLVSLLALALVLGLMVVSLSGCGEKSTTLTVFNWFDYIDEDVIKMFEQETGIKVNYTNFTTNEEMFAKLEKGSGSYDVIFPSDYIIERMIKEDMLAELDLSKMPNVANLVDWCKKPDYDPDCKYSVAYMWGTVGILYNTEKVDGEVTSWGSLFDPAYQRGVFMLDSIRDSFCVGLKYLGYSLNTQDEAALNAVKDLLLKQKEDGIVAGYLVDETKDKMIAGEAAVAMVWSGDATFCMSENDELDYVVPEEGSNIFYDSICIPANARNVSGAEKFIDFLCRGDIAAMNYEYVGYAIPNTAAIDIIGADEYNASPVNNPSQEALDHCQVFKYLGDDTKLYDQVWTEIISEF